MPWEIGILLAGASLLLWAVLALVTLAEIRRAGKNAAELTTTLDRHIPAIRQNLEDIGRNASALSASLRALSTKASETGKGFEKAAGGIRDLERDLREGLVVPLETLATGLSTLFAFGAAFRRFRHPLRRRRRGKGKA